MAASTSAVKTFILLFYVLSPFLHISCNELNCPADHYQELRQGKLSCQRCTNECHRLGHQMEDTACSQKQNRKCVCKPGFYCKEENKYNTYCHKGCEKCDEHTFSSKPSLKTFCQRHKNCTKIGMIMLNEGTTTQDTECVLPTTKMAPTTSIKNTNSSSNTITSVFSDPTGSSETITSNTITTSSSDTISTRSSNTITTGSSDTISTRSSNTITTGSSDTISTRSSKTITTGTSVISTNSAKILIMHSSKTTSSPGTGVTAPHHGEIKETQSFWLLFIILLILIIMIGFCMLTKGKAEKTISKFFGFVCQKHGDQDRPKQTRDGHQILSNHNVEAEIPLGSDAREVKGQRPQSGGVQQVTMEHNGKGENVSNTVGSIYIYSPGMVILGSNAGDKKEGSGACEEDVPLIGKPQQESNPPSQEVRIRMSSQEEAEEELSLRFPVPATGK